MLMKSKMTEKATIDNNEIRAGAMLLYQKDLPVPLQQTTVSATAVRHVPLRKQQYIRSRDLSNSSYQLQVERYKGLPVSLSCFKNDSSSTAQKLSIQPFSFDGDDTARHILNTSILFDYEITLRDPKEGIIEVLVDELPSWEFFLLYYVAEDIGIIGCHIGNQNISAIATDQATISSSNAVSNNSVDIIKLSSFGADVVDTRIKSCQVLLDLEPGYICIPLQGIMTAEFVGQESDRATIESFLSYHIAAAVNNSDFFGAGVEQSAFIGSRAVPSPAPLPASDVTRDIDDSNDSSSITVALASTISVAAFFFLFLLYFVMAKRGPRRTTTTDSAASPLNDDTSKKVVVVTDDEQTNFQQPLGVTTNPTQSLDSTSDKSDDARCGSVDTVNRLGREVIDGSVTMQGAYSLTNARTVSTVVSTDDSDIYIEDDETAKVDNTASSASIEPTPPVPILDSLPPKHPSAKTHVPPTVVAKVPKALRRRKKKKKKKSVATIVRSNSRENIKEMETITEVEEETSGDNIDANDISDDDDEEQEDGSWCSTSDSEPGSRDPSPARSSREPSPARSTNSGGGGNSGKKQAAIGLPPLIPTTVGPSPDRTIGTDKPNSSKSPRTWV